MREIGADVGPLRRPMQSTLRQSMALVHTWSGLAVAATLCVFVIVLAKMSGGF